MDEDQLDKFVQFARSYLSNPGRFVDITAAEGRARAYLMAHQPSDSGDDLLVRFIKESHNDKSSWDALNKIAQELIRKGDPLPLKLAEWTADVLADQSTKRGHKKRARPGKGGHATAGRDWNTYFLIDLLHKNWNITPTRNEVSDAESACDIVAKATGIPYGTVARIWSTCSNYDSHQMRKT